MHDDGKIRCSWAEGSAIERDYHDREWGVPLHDDRTLFEFLMLEGAQAGLSWRTVLTKRDNYRAAFADFDLVVCAGIDAARIEALLMDAGLIRNRLKITSVRDNARAALAAVEEFGSLDAYLWRFVAGCPVNERRVDRADVPATTPTSERMSKELRRRGFRFVGSTICYAFMQATGMVNDHVADCFRHPQIAQAPS